MAARYRLLVGGFKTACREYCGQRGIPRADRLDDAGGGNFAEGNRRTMTLADPMDLLWGLIAAAVIALYLRKVPGRGAGHGGRTFWDQVWAAAWARRRLATLAKSGLGGCATGRFVLLVAARRAGAGRPPRKAAYCRWRGGTMPTT